MPRGVVVKVVGDQEAVDRLFAQACEAGLLIDDVDEASVPVVDRGCEGGERDEPLLRSIDGSLIE